MGVVSTQANEEHYLHADQEKQVKHGEVKKAVKEMSFV